MPLSEHEQRLLDQIERALYQDDPKFATAVRSSDLRTHTRRRLWRAALLLVVGIALLLAGVIANPVIGVLGFVVMLGALVLALSSWRRLGNPGASATTLRSVDAEGRTGRARRTDRPAKRKGSAGSGSLKGRLEARWNRRWDERGRGE